jgi:hypothetical protein
MMLNPLATSFRQPSAALYYVHYSPVEKVPGTFGTSHVVSIFLRISYKNSNIEAAPVEKVLGTFGAAKVGCLALSQQQQSVKLGKYLRICLTDLFF